MVDFDLAEVVTAFLGSMWTAVHLYGHCCWGNSSLASCTFSPSLPPHSTSSCFLSAYACMEEGCMLNRVTMMLLHALFVKHCPIFFLGNNFCQGTVCPLTELTFTSIEVPLHLTSLLYSTTVPKYLDQKWLISLNTRVLRFNCINFPWFKNSNFNLNSELANLEAIIKWMIFKFSCLMYSICRMLIKGFTINMSNQKYKQSLPHLIGGLLIPCLCCFNTNLFHLNPLFHVWPTD